MNRIHNPYRSAEYVISAHQLKQLPADSGYEVAFAGRSNAGKSSAINSLTQNKKLARKVAETLLAGKAFTIQGMTETTATASAARRSTDWTVGWSA